jgi:hypothetical protein
MGKIKQMSLKYYFKIHILHPKQLYFIIVALKELLTLLRTIVVIKMNFNSLLTISEIIEYLFLKFMKV